LLLIYGFNFDVFFSNAVLKLFLTLFSLFDQLNVSIAKRGTFFVL